MRRLSAPLDCERAGPATTSDATLWRRDHRGQRCGMSSFQYRCRLPRPHSVLLLGPLVWAPLASLSLARQEHGRTIPLADSLSPGSRRRTVRGTAVHYP
jgi:hypothetical protein